MVVVTEDALNQTSPRILTVLLDASDTYLWPHDQRPVRLRDIRISATIDASMPYGLQMEVGVDVSGWPHCLVRVYHANPNLPKSRAVDLLDDVPIATIGTITDELIGEEVLEVADRWRGCLTLIGSQPLRVVNANDLVGMEAVILYDYP